MRLLSIALCLLIYVPQLYAVDFCGHETVRIERVSTGGIWPSSKDLYGPTGALQGRCEVVYDGGYYTFFTERDCVGFVSNYNYNNYGKFTCAQRGEAIDLWDGNADGNVCYACY